jgi:hypothetical protein
VFNSKFGHFYVETDIWVTADSTHSTHLASISTLLDGTHKTSLLDYKALFTEINKCELNVKTSKKMSIQTGNFTK